MTPQLRGGVGTGTAAVNRRPLRRRAAFATAAAVASWFGLVATARAASIEVTGDVAAQGYEVRSPWGDQVLGRRRLGTTVGLFVYNLQGDAVPLEADYSVRLLMRMDADLGITGSEASYTPANPTRYVPGLERAPVDLLYGYVEGRNLWDGWLGFRLGRQYQTDALGWWSFDGALARITTPFYLQAEVYGGFEQRGGLPLSSSRFEGQGVWRGSHGEIGHHAVDYPSYQPAELAPAFGVALESAGLSWLHGRLTYRRVYNTGGAMTGQFPTAADESASMSGTRISQDRLGYGLSAFLSDVGAVRGNMVYDFYGQLVSQIQAALDVHLGERVTIGVDGDYFVPTFDADSIWNWFTHSPVTTVRARASARPLERLELSGGAGVRLWSADGDPESFAREQCIWSTGGAPAAVERCLSWGTAAGSNNAAAYARQEAHRDTTIAPDLLADLGAGYRWGSGRAGLSAMLQQGIEAAGTQRGRRVGGSLSARQALDGGRYWLGGAVSLYDWSDPLRQDRDATSFGYVLAPEFVPVEMTRLRVEWQHDMNRLVGHRFRVIGLVAMRVAP